MIKKTKNPSAKAQIDFQEGDLVAVKVKGYPIWPGRIEEVKRQPRKKYVIRFFATNDTCTSYSVIKPFSQMTASERKCSSKRFDEAMRLCQEEERLQNRVKDEVTPIKEKEEEATPVEDEKEQTSPEEKDQTAPVEKEEDHKTSIEEEKGQTTSIKKEKDLDNPIDEEKDLDNRVEEEKDPDTPVEDEKDLGNPVEEKEDLVPPVKEEEEDLATPVKEEKESAIPVEEEKVKAIPAEVPADATRDEDLAKAGIAEKVEENNNTENKDHDVIDEKTDILPNMSSPDDGNESQPSEAEFKNEDTSTKHCSLNDLTSEQANADRGNHKPPSKRATKMQATDRELTIAKLEKKLEAKLQEKNEKKKAIKEQRSYEKALKGLPVFERKLDPLLKSIDRFIEKSNNPQVSNQVITSIQNCEKCLNPLAKCLKLMHSEYAKQQRECFLFYTSLCKIARGLKKIRDNKEWKGLKAREECIRFLKVLRASDEIKSFINSMEFPLYEDSMAERKENSKGEKRKSALRSEQLIKRVSSRT